MLLVRGITRRTGPRGISVRATGAWELSALWDAWTRGGLEAVLTTLEAEDREMVARNDAALAAAAEADGRDMPVAAKVSTSGGGRERGGDAADLESYTGLPRGDRDDADYAARFDRAAAVAAVAAGEEAAMRREPAAWAVAARCRRAARERQAPDGCSSTRPGSRQSPYADVKPAGEDTRGARALATSQTVPDAVPGSRRRDIAPAPTGRAAQGATGPTAKRGDTRDDVSTLGTPPRKLWHASPGSSGH